MMGHCVPHSYLQVGEYRSQVWSPDNGDRTYTNPVINADYSDPDVCVGPSGEDYYMTASSFQCTPGLPILHSKDLVNWEIVGYALDRLYEGDDKLIEHFNTPQHGAGVWAPSIRYHNGWYYIYWGDPDFGVYMVKTQNPAGKWEAPVCVIKGQGYIDTTPLWDDDGRCYLVNGWANSRAKFASVLTVRELSADGTKPIGQPVIVFDGNGTENRTCEGPKFYKRDGWYWIMCPAGGVPDGFQLAMRSKSPYGPYEHKIVLAQGKTNINGPHQGAWVHNKYNEDWFIHFQDKEAYGRVVHLNPVDWSTGWPIMGKKGEPVTTYKKPQSSSKVIVNPQESDEFNSTTIGKQWQWQANYDEKFGVPTAFGTLRIYNYKLPETEKNLFLVPNMLLQKTPADEFKATAKIRFTSKADGQMGGLIMMGLDYQALVVKRVGKEFQLLLLTCKNADKGKPQEEKLIATLKPTAEDKVDYKPGIHEDIYLRLTVTNAEAGVAHGGKPIVRFAYSLNNKKWSDCGSEFQMR
jgi:beta-xylosidase